MPIHAMISAIVSLDFTISGNLSLDPTIPANLSLDRIEVSEPRPYLTECLFKRGTPATGHQGGTRVDARLNGMI